MVVLIIICTSISQQSSCAAPDDDAGSELYKEALAKVMLRYALKRSDFHDEVQRQRESFPDMDYDTIEILAFFKYYQQV